MKNEGKRNKGFYLRGNQSFKISLNIKSERGDVLVTIKDKKGNLLFNNGMST